MLPLNQRFGTLVCKSTKALGKLETGSAYSLPAPQRTHAACSCLTLTTGRCCSACHKSKASYPFSQFSAVGPSSHASRRRARSILIPALPFSTRDSVVEFDLLLKPYIQQKVPEVESNRIHLRYASISIDVSRRSTMGVRKTVRFRPPKQSPAFPFSRPAHYSQSPQRTLLYRPGPAKALPPS